MKDITRLQVRPGHRIKWSRIDCDDKGRFKHKDEAVSDMEACLHLLDTLQDRLYAEQKRSLLIVLQGMDTSGKDGTIRHVLRGVNPQGCIVTSFKQPTPEEAAHDFLWRVHRHTPARGYMGIFNRSHYEDVLVTRVHGTISDQEARKRFAEINEFESLLARNGTVILKFFLAISKEEQRQRLQDRIDDKDKHWKFNPQDLVERQHWKDYERVYTDAISATSTGQAPWFVIPSNHKWYRNYLVAKILARTLQAMKLKYPEDAKNITKTRIPR